MTKVEPSKNINSPKFKMTAPKRNPLHVCPMCGSNFSHLFAYNRHLMRQHWFEAHKDFSEEKLKAKVEGLTEKQSQKLRELYKKLKERNSPTPPKRSRRSKQQSLRDPYSGSGAKVANLKEYKLVTVDDMSEAYKDKYQNPGGYTIFHFKVPKKNGPVVSPPLTALKKTYHTADNKISQKTEKVPVTTSTQLSSWQQESFESHLSRRLSRPPSTSSQPMTSQRHAPSQRSVTSKRHVISPRASSHVTPHVTPIPCHVTAHPYHHAGCGKCRRRNHSGGCDGHECADKAGSYPATVPLSYTSPLNYTSPLLSAQFNCTDILNKIINSPESLSKPKISLTVVEGEPKVDVMSIDLTPSPSPSSSRSESSPCSSKDWNEGVEDMTSTLLAQIGLEMVYNHYFQPP